MDRAGAAGADLLQALLEGTAVRKFVHCRDGQVQTAAWVRMLKLLLIVFVCAASGPAVAGHGKMQEPPTRKATNRKLRRLLASLLDWED
jgi:hypothetical protein